jgi:4-amino-4-deoxy-L-arabinose transferase-like glycosyltransferase
MDRRLACLYALLVAVAAFALFANLDDRFLWGDESHSAYLAQNILRFGLPLASDGVNDFAQYGRDAWTSRSGVWIWTPWLAEYVAAGSFLLLGETTLAARLPFVVVAFLSVLLFARLVYRVYGSHELALSATLLYVTCVPLLLHARQCRYYALVLFAQVWLLFGFHRVVRGDRLRGALHLAAALTVQFYSSYLVVPVNMLALAVAALLLRRRLPDVVPGVGLGVALALAAAVPWLLYADPLGQTDLMGAAGPLRIGGFYLRAVHFHIVPLAIFLLAPLAIRRRRARLEARSDPAARAVDMPASRRASSATWSR